MKKHILIILLIAVFAFMGCGENIDPNYDADDRDIPINISDGEEVPIGDAPSLEDAEDDDSSENNSSENEEDTGESTDDRRPTRTRGNEDPAGELKLLSSTKLPDAVVGVEYSKGSRVMPGGGDQNYTFAADGLPSGLSFDSTTRRISGVPTTVGHYDVTFNVTDGEGSRVSATSSLTVKDNIALNLLMQTQDGSEVFISEDDNTERIEIVTSAKIIASVDGKGSEYKWEIKVDGSPQSDTSGGKEKEVYLPETTEQDQIISISIKVEDDFGSMASFDGEYVLQKDACKQEIEVGDTSDREIEGDIIEKTIIFEGGKAEYILSGVEYRVIAIDDDGNEIEEIPWEPVGSDILTGENVDGGYRFLMNRKGYRWGLGLSELWTTASFMIGNIYAPCEDCEPGKKYVGYRVEARYSVTDSCVGRTPVEKTVVVDIYELKKPTLDQLMIQCDYEDISHASKGNAYYMYRIKVAGIWVAEVTHKFKNCQGDAEWNCEDARPFRVHTDNPNVDLSEYSLDDIEEINIRKHQHRGTCGADGYWSKLDADLQWCRFFTRGNGAGDEWIGIFNDQEHGDKLNQNEVGGNRCNYKHDNVRKEQHIEMRMDNYPNIWRPGYLLDEKYVIPPSYVAHQNVIED